MALAQIFHRIPAGGARWRAINETLKAFSSKMAAYGEGVMASRGIAGSAGGEKEYECGGVLALAGARGGVGWWRAQASCWRWTA